MVAVCLLAQLLLSCSMTQAEVREPVLTLRVGAYDNHPKIYPLAGGEYGGIFPDILNAIAGDEGWSIEWVAGSWSQCLERLENGQIDMMVDVALSDERQKRFDFNEETILVNWGVVYSRPGSDVDSILALQDATIAVMRNSIHTTGDGGIVSLLDQFGVQCALIEVDSYEEVFRLLEEGRADAGVVNRIFGSLFRQEYNVDPTPIVFNPRQIMFAFPRSAALNDYLISHIDDHVRRMQHDPDSVLRKTLDLHLSGLGRALDDDGGHPRIPLSTVEQAWIRDHPVIRLGVDPEFVPFEYIDEEGTYHGIASDYMELLGERLGLHLEVVPGLSWREAVEGAANGTVDVLPCVGMTEERMAFLRFTKPYIRFQRVIISRIDAPFIIGLEDIADMHVAVQADSSHEGFLLENSDIDPVRYDTLQAALAAVAGGEADVLVGNLASCSYWIRRLSLSNLKVVAPISGGEQALYLGVRQDWPQLVRILNKGLASITEEEEHTILQRWIRLEYESKLNPGDVARYLLKGAAIGLPLLLVLLMWNYGLKRQIIRRKTAEDHLKQRVSKEHLLATLSSRFISLRPEEVDDNITQALGLVAGHLGVAYGFLYTFQSGGADIVHIWPDKNGSDAPWLPVLRPDGQWRPVLLQDPCPVIIRNSEDGGSLVPCTDGSGSCPLDQEDRSSPSRPPEGQDYSGSYLCVPRKPHGAVTGLIGFGSQNTEHDWQPDDVGMVRFVEEIITSALLRKKSREDLKRSSLELAESNRRLKELDRLKSMFIASMSHELRTPLNSIIGFTGVLLQGMSGELNDRQKDQLGRANQSARHLLAMITDIIDISKIEAGRVDVLVESFDLTEVLQEAIDSIIHDLEKKQLRLKLDIQAGIEVRTDRKRLFQCVLNFLSNAVKYSDEGLVVLSAARNDGQVTISVSDTGIGIDEKDLPRLFEAFERLESHLKVKAGGTGLGLYLTRQLASKILHGEVWVESEPGKGSTFGLTIPADLGRTATDSNGEEA